MSYMTRKTNLSGGRPTCFRSACFDTSNPTPYGMQTTGTGDFLETASCTKRLGTHTSSTSEKLLSHWSGNSASSQCQKPMVYPPEKNSDGRC